jgi:hypothetical protein
MTGSCLLLQPSLVLPVKQFTHCMQRLGKFWEPQRCCATKYRWGWSGYSRRRAFMGEIEAARLAGMMAAKKEHVPKAMAAAESAAGSQEATP